ncbi:hypothetical protein IJH46_02980 [Candidatus Saccharibacteria bacterium]|nr:hypothetical protein [Candidatus Saccharibacteria bacterium]
MKYEIITEYGSSPQNAADHLSREVGNYLRTLHEDTKVHISDAQIYRNPLANPDEQEESKKLWFAYATVQVIH